MGDGAVGLAADVCCLGLCPASFVGARLGAGSWCRSAHAARALSDRIHKGIQSLRGAARAASGGAEAVAASSGPGES